MSRPDTGQFVTAALSTGTAVPAFNIPYLPMVEPTVRALRDCDCVGLVVVAHLEFHKFEARSLQAVRDAYREHADDRHTRLHLDHMPVIDEDGADVDYRGGIEEALALGYESVMVDASRLGFEANIAATRGIVEMAHSRDVPVEAELGAVAGHEAGELPPYEELFASKRGFTDPGEARAFVERTGVDWLSVSVGSIHGAISRARKDERKPGARLDIPRLRAIAETTSVPLVLHGGTGIPSEIVRDGIANGIAKINIATATRQPYERALPSGENAAREAVYQAACRVITEDLKLAGSAPRLHAALNGGMS